MPFKKTKIVCVYQKLDEVENKNCLDFSAIINIDFKSKECIVRQITYSSNTINGYEYGNFTIWSSLNSGYIGSFSLKPNLLWNDAVADEDHYVSSSSESPNTIITLDQKTINDVRFVIYDGLLKAVPLNKLKGEVCMILEFRE